jgi:sugar phosphate isomerase/epimerase
MKSQNQLSRRGFLAASVAAPLFSAAAQARRVPIGIELYAVRNELTKDLKATVRAVAKMGYEVVEFYSPYTSWTTDYAKEIRGLMDELKIRCLSTHNDMRSFSGDGLAKAVELNRIIGSRYIVMASAGTPQGLDGWKKVADTLTAADEKFAAAGIHAGYHNHQTEFKPLGGKRPIEVIAAGTPKDVMLQFDVGTCVEVGSDPVAWINANPGRIKSLHLKDWGKGEGPERGYRTLFGEGDVPWKDVIAAAQKTGGLEFMLIEQEGSRFSELESAQRCLDSLKKLMGA